MVKEAARRAYEDGDALSQAGFLFLGVLAAHNRGADHVSEHLRCQALQLDVYLSAKLARGAENYAVSAIVSPDLLDVQGVHGKFFDQGDEIGERLPTASL